MIVGLIDWFNERLGSAHAVNKALRKAFPDHWSFMIGEINAYAFLLLVVTGTFLALLFDPSTASVRYHGPYTLLDGVTMSQAYRSAMRLSFEVNGGLLIRQVHHWTALIFLSGIVVHLCRIFFTGAFRKPREINWVIGITLFVLAMFAGFTGYSVPDDLLSGAGLRIADAVLLSVPFIGTRTSMLLLGGAFPSEQMIPRLFVTHIYIIPAAIAALITLHLAIVWRQKHTQFRGIGRTEDNVIGSPLFPKYALKSFALLLALTAVAFALGALVQINPIWLYGPYNASIVFSPVQPDWYVGWVEGALRLGPAFALHLLGHSVPSPFWPAVFVPACIFGILLCWPWIEAAATGDRRAHHLLDWPSDAPLRTAIGAAGLAFVGILLLAGSDDVQVRYTHWSIESLVVAYRWLCIFAPVVAFLITYVLASELRGRHGVHHAPRVRLRRNAAGGFDEEPIP